MINESTVKLKISLNDSELDPEELDRLTRSVLRDVKGLVEDASMAESEEITSDIHRGGIVPAVLGVLNAEVNIANLKTFLGLLGDRLGSKPIKITVKKPDATEFSIEASSRKELETATQTILELMKNT
ncbi:MAG: sugar ABC transporter permease [Calothrix sp. MO_167.B12]|nr:sugar ABC transporter permease [Calothrix sp. MO_167.B12]